MFLHISKHLGILIDRHQYSYIIQRQSGLIFDNDPDIFLGNPEEEKAMIANKASVAAKTQEAQL